MKISLASPFGRLHYFQLMFIFLFLCIIFIPNTTEAQVSKINPDQWYATDALGRKTTEYYQAGDIREGKFVGMFYLTWHDHFSKRPRFGNTSQILRAHPEAANDENHPAWENFWGDYFWDEPLFGYYSTMDEWVLRKHGEMLADAGVDVIFMDATNSTLTYMDVVLKLLEVWSKARQDGVKTPQVCFVMPFGALPNAKFSMTEVFAKLYEPGLYKDLWFMWRGKPLMMAYPESLNQPDFDSRAGMKFTATEAFNGVDVYCPSYNNNLGSLTLSLYRWDTNYATSVAGTPLARQTFTNYFDNARLLLTTSDLAPGDYVWEISDPDEDVGVWKFGSGSSTNISYVNGVPTTGHFDARIRRAANNTMIALATGAINSYTPVKLMKGSYPVDLEKLRNFFTFRPPVGSLANGPSRPDEWGWLESYPQHGFGPTATGFEQVTVGVAINASDESRGLCTAFNAPGTYGRSYTNAYGQSADTAAYLWAPNFDEQWGRAFELDPELAFVDGWNEWIAYRHKGWTDCAGQTITTHAFPDQYNWDKNRDIEPVKGWGRFGDVTYNQLVMQTRRFKGMQKPEVAPAEKTIPIGSFSGWNDVLPEYHHYKGNTLHRSHYGYASLQYINTTGRNDIVLAKVARDAQQLYFYVETAEPVTAYSGSDWMQLFIDIDRNKATGWEGYDFMLNRTSPTQTTMTIERSTDSWNWTSVGQVGYALINNKIEIAIPRALLGEHAADTLDFEFKWADNAQLEGNIMNFYVNGDAAPGGRFNFRYSSHVKPDPVIRKPYRIDALRIPTTLQAQEFDKGGQQFTFYDKSEENSSGAFRPAEAVDIAPTTDTKGQFDVVNIEAGEWLDYSIHSTKTQLYFLEIRYAATGTTSLHFEVNGEAVSGIQTLEGTGSESTYKTFVTAFELPQGIYPLRVVFDHPGSGLRVNYFNFLNQDPACGNRTEWNFNYSSDCWSPNNSINGTAQNGTYILNISNTAPNITSFGGLQIPGRVYKWVKIRIKNNSNATRAKLQWLAFNETEWNPSRVVEFELSDNNADFVDYYLNPDLNSLWRTTLKQLKLEFPDASQGSIEIDQIQLATTNTSRNDDITQLNITLSPNPARDEFTISSGSTRIEKMEIIDMQGRIVYTDEQNFDGNKIVTESLRKGVYLIKLKTETNNNVIKRLMIQ